MTTEIAQVESLNQIQTGLQAFEERKEKVSALAEKTSLLELTDWKDKESLKLVSSFRKEIKSERVAIQKEGKAMRDLITPINKHILSKEKELVDILEPQEQRLQRLEDWAEAELEKEKQAAIEAENARIQNRIDALAEFGYQIDYTDVKSMSDETFGKYLDGAKAQFEKEQAEKAEAERLRLEQEEKERLEREAEAKRLQEERAELEKMRAENEKLKQEQEAKEREMETERARLADVKLALKLEKRRNQLKSIGGDNEFGNDSFKYKDRILANFYDIHDKNDAEWDTFFASLLPGIEKYEKELADAEQKRLDDIAKAAEEARLKAIQDAKDAEAKRIEDERKKKEAEERKAARQPDKVKILKYLDSLATVPFPELKTKDGMAAWNDIIIKVTNAISYSKNLSELL